MCWTFVIRYYLWPCWRLIEAKAQLKSIGRIHSQLELSGFWLKARIFTEVRDQPNKPFLVSDSTLAPCLNLAWQREKQEDYSWTAWVSLLAVASGEGLRKAAASSHLPGSCRRDGGSWLRGPYLRMPAHTKAEAAIPTGRVSCLYVIDRKQLLFSTTWANNSLVLSNLMNKAQKCTRPHRFYQATQLLRHPGNLPPNLCLLLPPAFPSLWTPNVPTPCHTHTRAYLR